MTTFKNGTEVTIISSDFLRSKPSLARLIGRRGTVVNSVPTGRATVKVAGVRSPLYFYQEELVVVAK